MSISSLQWQPRKSFALLALLIVAALAGIVLSKLLHRETIPLAAGEATVFNRSSSAYEQPAVGLTKEEMERHRKGDLAFDAVFVTAPAEVNPGLGPFFNNASCGGCHLRDGRGLAERGQLLVRVSSNNAQTSKSPADPSKFHSEGLVEIENTPPVPGLGNQIQDSSIFGRVPEAKVSIQWQETEGKYRDGNSYRLRSPKTNISLPNGQPLSKEVLTSLRIPPPVFGLGLLEAVPEETIRNLADPEDQNQDGISGRPNQVWDVSAKSTALGRFGLKANTPNLLQQTAAAYVNDMGITNPLFPEGNGETDIDRETLENAAFYVQTLGVPARTLLDDSQVKRGEKLFAQANCSACHVPELRTGNYKVKALANQTIHPYTDLLLHDMGEGLADNRPDFKATGTEWRTPALWGIGLTQTVLPYSGYLHDGRARTLEEAILWHGGEAQASKEAFAKMSKRDRAALVRFLNSL
ncbi:putative thiol oxidoreductase [Pleurocapsa sp. PCC 7327]|uniref:di-heme oxidoreductase family protein n=1 Tax=Pleurocapsa sp. PCC 7327 TaxID=118163 RepID=UPI00029FE4F9|nr:di-heme oxidoredictase family protein [Pleurocapsa sp. PCC 7327]AFY77202.1 putative thiol oxidoreductase [Pleurocapsa sp. PCC 7327]